MPEVFVLVGKFAGDQEFRHYGLAVKLVILNLICQVHSVADRLGNIGKDVQHLICTLQVLLFGIAKSLKVIDILARIEANKTIVSLGVILHYEVDVVRGYYFNIVFCCQLTVCGYHPLLLGEDGNIGCRISCFVALHLKVVVVTEDLTV